MKSPLKLQSLEDFFVELQTMNAQEITDKRQFILHLAKMVGLCYSISQEGQLLVGDLSKLLASPNALGMSEKIEELEKLMNGLQKKDNN